MKSFCIIGLGRFGQTLATSLAESGYQVMVIDTESDVVNAIADTVTNAVVGDPTNESVLKASGIKDYDCVIICISRNIYDSILITLTLKDLGIKHIVVRATSEQHMRILEKIGADEIVFPERDMGERIAKKLSMPNVRDYLEIYDGCSIAEIDVPDKWVGKTIAQVDVRKKYGLNIISLRRGTEANVIVSPSPDTVFEKFDAVTFMGNEDNIYKITNSL